MRVLLRLGDVQLRGAGAREHSRQRRGGILGRERDGVGPALLVLGQRRVVPDRRGPPPALPPWQLAQLGWATSELLLAQRPCELTHAVRPEVEGDHAVLGADRLLLAD